MTIINHEQNISNRLFLDKPSASILGLAEGCAIDDNLFLLINAI